MSEYARTWMSAVSAVLSGVKARREQFIFSDNADLILLQILCYCVTFQHLRRTRECKFVHASKKIVTGD